MQAIAQRVSIENTINRPPQKKETQEKQTNQQNLCEKVSSKPDENDTLRKFCENNFREKYNLALISRDEQAPLCKESTDLDS